MANPRVPNKEATKVRAKSTQKKGRGGAMKRETPQSLAQKLGVSPARGLEAILKVQIITGIKAAVKAGHVTEREIVTRSGIPRITVAGILNGSEQRVTLDRVLQILVAANLTAEMKIKRAA
jgi:predicted XRE-type DNA-binding protein